MPAPVPVPVPESNASAWRVVRGWFKDEEFYKDIATESLAVGLVALIVYIYAVAVGLIARPPAQYVIGIAWTAGCVSLAFASFVARKRRTKLILIILTLALQLGGLASLSFITVSMTPEELHTFTLWNYGLFGVLFTAWLAMGIAESIKDRRKGRRARG